MASFQIVKFKAGKVIFEILTKPGTVLKYRDGKIGSIDNVLFSDDIFTDQKKGVRASDQALKAAFDTTNVQEIMTTILDKGELELSAAERKEAVAQKRAEVLNYLHKHYINPETHLPHPLVRLENALEQAKIKIDGDTPADKQAQEAVKKIIPLIGMRKVQMAGTFTIPVAYSSAANGAIRKIIKVSSEKYTSEHMILQAEFLPGDFDTILAELGRVTSGDFNFAIEGEGIPTAAETTSSGKGGKKKGKAAAAKATSSNSATSSVPSAKTTTAKK